MTDGPSDNTATNDAVAAPAAAEPNEREILAVLDEVLPAGRADLSRRGGDGTGADANLIAVLQHVQDRLGYLPAGALREISRRTKVPLSRVYGVVSFYAQFYTAPRGRHTIRCCRGTACHVRGAGRVLDAVRRVLGIDEGQTTPDRMFYLETIACLGTCFLAPAMMIDGQYYGKLTPQRIEQILATYREGRP